MNYKNIDSTKKADKEVLIDIVTPKNLETQENAYISTLKDGKISCLKPYFVEDISMFNNRVLKHNSSNEVLVLKSTK